MIAYRPYPQVNAPRANEIVIMESTHGNLSSALFLGPNCLFQKKQAIQARAASWAGSSSIVQ